MRYPEVVEGMNMNRLFQASGLVRIASTVQTTHPDAAKALEQSWQRRRQELAGWQPSRGWLVDAQVSPQRPAAAGK
jgi:hypothetical protein